MISSTLEIFTGSLPVTGREPVEIFHGDEIMFESEIAEFKRELNDSVIKEIIAFCNTNGGTIIIGYDDNGVAVGLENAKEDLDRLSNKINDSIEPSVNFLVSSKI